MGIGNGLFCYQLAQVMKQPLPTRNPGPPFGYHILQWADHAFPASVFCHLKRLGCKVAVALMPRQRAASRAYLQTIGAQVNSQDPVLDHFEVFADTLIERLRLARGIVPKIALNETEDVDAFLALCQSPRLALFGTFHIGQSDILGCMLTKFGRKVALVRRKVGNSKDIEVMQSTFADTMKILWINHRQMFFLDLKQALDEGYSIGFQCDRSEYGGDMESFEFLGGCRLFPTTIYRLSRIMNLPVVFAFAGEKDQTGATRVTVSKVFEPEDCDDFDAARKEHFRHVLAVAEAHLKQYPLLWFNFGSLHQTPGREDAS